jgi:NRAMP (natural resistance-associated macrophage protein)-like metal ion transporter
MVEDNLEKIASAPALVLDKTLDTSRGIIENTKDLLRLKKAKEYWHILGPGLTTGAADDDPSGIGTYSQAGAQYGNQLLWLSWATFPLMGVVQEMCARIAMSTGRGLAGNIKHFFPRWVLYACTFLLFVANTFNIGADLGAMAKASQLLFPQIGFGILVIFFGVLSLGLQIFTTYQQYSKYLKWLALILASYILSSLSIKGIDWGHVMQSAIIPSISLSKEQIILICGILGTTISPYLFFWQTSQEIEEEILQGKTTIESRSTPNKKEIRHMRIDVWSGMFISNLVMFFIILATSATLFSNGITNIKTAADAAIALKPFAGDAAYLLFALGIIGTGMLAIPVLAGSASYAMSECFGWDHGLNRTLKQASAFYGIIIFSMIIGFILNFVGLDPIKALIYSAVLNGMIAPVILILIVIISSSKKIMGDNSNHPIAEFLGWVITGIMILAGGATIISIINP